MHDLAKNPFQSRRTKLPLRPNRETQKAEEKHDGKADQAPDVVAVHGLRGGSARGGSCDGGGGRGRGDRGRVGIRKDCAKQGGCL